MTWHGSQLRRECHGHSHTFAPRVYRVRQQADLESLTPEEARKLLGTAHRWMLEGMKIERLETKDAREVDEIPHPPKPIQQMNDAELDAYIAQP